MGRFLNTMKKLFHINQYLLLLGLAIPVGFLAYFGDLFGSFEDFFIFMLSTGYNAIPFVLLFFINQLSKKSCYFLSITTLEIILTIILVLYLYYGSFIAHLDPQSAIVIFFAPIYAVILILCLAVVLQGIPYLFFKIKKLTS